MEKKPLPLSIGIAGCTGRMGRLLVREVLNNKSTFTLAAGSVVETDPALGQDIGIAAGLPAIDMKAISAAEDLFSACDLVIDFTVPEATRRHIWLAAKHHKPLVVGTTGLTAKDESELLDAANEAPILYAANMSLGVTIMTALTEKIASLLGPENWDIEINETHHRHKADAPSGTALALGRAAAKGRGREFKDVGIYGREGHTGERVHGAIGFAVQRGGDVAGEHSVTFFGEGERLQISHVASDRALFARGAIRAAFWLHDKPRGLYTMRDVLGLD
jgi:4-hydroxy-tetrahydrodipicolinate reductase